MRSDTVSILNEFTGEQLLWLAIRSNASMRAKVERVIESRARLRASLKPIVALASARASSSRSPALAR
jgi:hypothetical protein